MRLPGQITYSEMFTVQPFSNVMNVKTMTGDAIYRLLEQQFTTPAAGAIRLLQVSNGFTYSYDFRRPAGSRVTPGQRRDQRRADHGDRHLPRRDEQLPRDRR